MIFESGFAKIHKEDAGETDNQAQAFIEVQFVVFIVEVRQHQGKESSGGGKDRAYDASGVANADIEENVLDSRLEDAECDQRH